jgi:DNA repair photolyase
MIQDYQKGRGAQINTINPFAPQQPTSRHIEGIDEPEDRGGKTEILQEQPAKIISTNNSPDIPFDYSINPYQGCEHGCVYCYARNTHEYWGYSAGLDWESKIMAKTSAAELLERKFLSKGWKSATVMLSGNTDPYQPVERKLKITRSLLEVFLKYHNPVGIITKSVLILRDLDLLVPLAKENLVRVFFSITTLDEKLRRLLEPRSANGHKMLKAMRRLSDNNVPVGIMFSPVIPSLNDHEMDNVLRLSSDHGALGAGYTIARFNGSIEEIFRDWLEKNYPDRFEKVWNKVCDFHGGSVKDSEWGRRLRGAGKYADMIRMMFERSREKWLAGREFPPLDNSKFRAGGNLRLF